MTSAETSAEAWGMISAENAGNVFPPVLITAFKLVNVSQREILCHC